MKPKKLFKTSKKATSSAGANEIMGAEIAAPAPSEFADVVQIAGSNTFKLVQGVWVDTRFDLDTGQTQKVPFLSEDYFQLVNASEEIASAFALGERVLVISGGIAYEVVDSSESGDKVSLPPVPVENPEIEVTGEDEPEASNPSGFALPTCTSAILPIALLLIPLRRRRRIS